jgi:uncharacterized protein YjbJ (UPF0337 family)
MRVHRRRDALARTKQENAMNWDRVEGNWKQYKGKLQERWGKLTNDDLDRIRGKREQLEGQLQAAYGLEKEQVQKDIDEFCKTL